MKLSARRVDWALVIVDDVLGLHPLARMFIHEDTRALHIGAIGRKTTNIGSRCGVDEGAREEAVSLTKNRHQVAGLFIPVGLNPQTVGFAIQRGTGELVLGSRSVLKTLPKIKSVGTRTGLTAVHLGDLVGGTRHVNRRGHALRKELHIHRSSFRDRAQTIRHGGGCTGIYFPGTARESMRRIGHIRLAVDITIFNGVGLNGARHGIRLRPFGLNNLTGGRCLCSIRVEKSR
ncbi:hypothetical protein [Actinobaculum suis]|uniref:Uncharacterized protein n=1 Tax=Actinobaculum suis TaxID=1657 RepID=A0AAW9HMV1_9ACTO|nr:hypothetical protein [Actinobaculum suis]MDY5154052.1 hypothetical protein [Actinobaculum suis]